MKHFKSQARREIALISIVSVLALAPLLFLGFKSVFGPRPAKSFRPLKPSIARLSRDTDGYLSSESVLSPDGRWIASMEVSASEVAAQRSPKSLSPNPNELVIRSASNGHEVFRALAVGQFVGWIPQSIGFVAQNGFDINVFSPATRKPGTPVPAEPWSATLVSLPQGSDSTYSTTGAGGATTLTLENSAIAFSPDFRFAVKASWNGGDVHWIVADLTTGKISAPIKAGRWLNYKPEERESRNISIRVAPANLASGAWPRVALVQTTRPDSYYKLPHPTATPLPTPVLSPEQARFMKDEARNGPREAAALKDLDKKMRSSADIKEARRWMAEIDHRLYAYASKQRRLFPQGLYRQTTFPKLEDAKPFQIECFDLKTRKKLWTVPVRNVSDEPKAEFSPDGAALVVWNTANIVKGGDDYLSLKNTGIDFFATSTGKKRAHFRLFEETFWPANPHETLFYREATANGPVHSIFMTRDKRRTEKDIIPVLRFFDTTTASEIGHLDMDVTRYDINFKHSLTDFSTDDNGLLWIFGGNGYEFLPRSRLGREFSTPLPQPTPTPTMAPLSTPMPYPAP